MLKSNFPGYEWMKDFVKRHNLTSHVAANVKPNRAEIKLAVIKEYFNNLASLLQDVPAANGFNKITTMKQTV